MKIAIVDDDENQIAYTSKLISNELLALGDLTYKIDTYHCGEDFLARWKPNLYDLVILDIFMGGMTGVDVAYKIREGDNHVILAFCTSSNEYASESYDVGAKHYLRKPITADSISKMFKKINFDNLEVLRSVHLPDGHNIILRSILYTEYDNHVVTVHIKNEPPHRLRISQSEIEALLLENDFFCSPYKGITMNFQNVKEISDTDATLVDGTRLPITRRKIKDVKEAYKKFKFNEARNKIKKELGV